MQSSITSEKGDFFFNIVIICCISKPLHHCSQRQTCRRLFEKKNWKKSARHLTIFFVFQKYFPISLPLSPGSFFVLVYHKINWWKQRYTRFLIIRLLNKFKFDQKLQKLIFHNFNMKRKQFLKKIFFCLPKMWFW